MESKNNEKNRESLAKSYSKSSLPRRIIQGFGLFVILYSLSFSLMIVDVFMLSCSSCTHNHVDNLICVIGINAMMYLLGFYLMFLSQQDLEENNEQDN